MMAVDTSALMAMILNEHRAAACTKALRSDPKRLVSAVTMAEALIVANGKNVLREMTEFLDELDCELVAVSAATARRVSQVY
jgi:ribonuclease VapC